ncbi:MAG: macrocin O-methyltransferase [Rhodospirillaceae bacterium]|nr:MAG: macrocin O-methyltransferase [Rhodospirillaceae bacterium]
MRINKNALVKAFAHLFGMEAYKPGKFPKDFGDEAIATIRAVTPFTMIGKDRLFALITAVRYISKHNVKGAIVECGVWRGGASGSAALTLKALGEQRDLYLFDTFEGMSIPTVEDKALGGDDAMQEFLDKRTGEETSDWCMASLEDVQANLTTLGLNIDDFHFVKGMVEDTIPSQSPKGEIAILRLDTDWYKSTKHEMDHLFPQLVSGGVLIIDDYGDWEGARQAVDEYLDLHNIRMLLTRVNGSVVGIKE